MARKFFASASLSSTTMPGSTTIYGLLPLSNRQCLDKAKPRSISFDAEILMGHNVKGAGEPQIAKALLHYFVPQEHVPDEELIYFIAGKIVSTKHDSRNPNDYDFEIDAFMVCLNNFPVFV